MPLLAHKFVCLWHEHTVCDGIALDYTVKMNKTGLGEGAGYSLIDKTYKHRAIEGIAIFAISGLL